MFGIVGSVINQNVTMMSCLPTCREVLARAVVVFELPRGTSAIKQVTETEQFIRSNQRFGGVVARASDLRSTDGEFGRALSD